MYVNKRHSAANNEKRKWVYLLVKEIFNLTKETFLYVRRENTYHITIKFSYFFANMTDDALCNSKGTEIP